MNKLSRSIIQELSEEELEQIFHEAQELEKTGTTGNTKLRSIAESLPNYSSIALSLSHVVTEVYRHYAWKYFFDNNKLSNDQ